MRAVGRGRAVGTASVGKGLGDIGPARSHFSASTPGDSVVRQFRFSVTAFSFHVWFLMRVQCNSYSWFSMDKAVFFEENPFKGYNSVVLGIFTDMCTTVNPF